MPISFTKTGVAAGEAELDIILQDKGGFSTLRGKPPHAQV
eukprot:CAMPEP_0172660534 /NCGR_PEP_ID=MMETSP1074-20121228/4115_1 /TAXON_ID=2916 /ORGANISM="Ceratium fusus, Strain PA161109" /LENGTH=39 /DNA_ID= /DNA_START= /DNA_END= /DNA_ORIENTATION=